MASPKKTKKKKSSESAKLKPDPQERITLKQIIRDERTYKIVGALSILLALFLFLSFASYLFTWKTDQPLAREGASALLPSEKLKAENLLGNLGAYISHRFFFNGFGLASFFFCSFFFILGANLLFKRKMFSIGRNIRYVVSGLLFFSVALAFFTKGNPFPWGGGVGMLISDWLTKILGWLGTAAVLIIAGLAYIIWRFNPVFRVPNLKKQNQSAEETVMPEAVIDGPKLFVDQSFEPVDGDNIQIGAAPMLLIEKEEALPVKEFMEGTHWTQDEEEIKKPSGKNNKPRTVIPDLDLEIKKTESLKEAENPEASVKTRNTLLTDYEPTLDLQNYKYPSLELLESHGSDKIIQDAVELEGNKNQIIKRSVRLWAQR